MARPKGRFDLQKAACLKILTSLTKPRCWASNEWLAKKLGCSVRQVSRYLLALETEKKIIRQQYRYLKGGALKTRRYVYMATAKWMPALVKKDYVNPRPKVRYVMSKTPETKPEPTPEPEKPKFDVQAWARAHGVVERVETPMQRLKRENPAEFYRLQHLRIASCVTANNRSSDDSRFSPEVQKALSQIPRK